MGANMELRRGAPGGAISVLHKRSNGTNTEACRKKTMNSTKEPIADAASHYIYIHGLLC